MNEVLHAWNTTGPLPPARLRMPLMRSKSGPRSAISVSIARRNTGHCIGFFSRMTKLAMPSLCSASATKPEWRDAVAPGRNRSDAPGSISPSSTISISARGLSFLQLRGQPLSAPAVRQIDLRNRRADRPGSPACVPPAPFSGCAARSPRRPPSAPPRWRIRRRARGRWRMSAGSGSGSASPLVSISTRPKCGILPRSRSATRRRSAICKSLRVLQHRQPLPSNVTSSVLVRSSASSMPTEPNSLTISAVPRPSGDARKRRTSVVLPAPRKPVTMVTGSRDPRSRFCRRPNGRRRRWEQVVNRIRRHGRA